MDTSLSLSNALFVNAVCRLELVHHIYITFCMRPAGNCTRVCTCTHVRKHLNTHAPHAVEEYYQQIGRAGRDGLMSECIMFSKPIDFTRWCVCARARVCVCARAHACIFVPVPCVIP